MLKNKKIIVLMLLITVMSLGLASCGGKESNDADTPEPMDKPVVNIGYVSWAECVATSNLWKVILEDKGYDVNLIQLDAAPLYIGLKKGDVDLFLDSWLPVTHGNYMEKYGKDLTDVGIWYESPAKIGVVVPSYVEIDSLEKFNGSKDKFNKEIIGIDPGAGIMKAAETAKEEYGFDANIVQGSETAMITSLQKAYDKGDWIAITGWSPHWMFAEYDLKYLEDPKKAFGEEEFLHVLANKKFGETHNDIITMLSNFKMNDSQIGALEKLINDGLEPELAAQQWVDENKEIVDSWTTL